MKQLGILIAVGVFLRVALAFALDVPFLSGRINDTAHMLGSGTAAELEAMLKSYEDSTTHQIVLLTIPSLEGEAIEDYAFRVAETWKLGQRGVDNGILLLISRADRKLRIEVGYGLESEVTDAVANYIINGIITPRFKQGDFEGGIREGLLALTKAADGALSESRVASFAEDDFPMLFFLLFWFSIVGLFTLIALVTPGCGGWFMFAFLIPFYAIPSGLIFAEGHTWGISIVFIYLIVFPLLKIVMPKTTFGARFFEKVLAWSAKSSGKGRRTGYSSGGWSSSSGWSSGGSSFSGGGGSFGGGGSSGSW